jgi:hypothetical protein
VTKSSASTSQPGRRSAPPRNTRLKATMPSANNDGRRCRPRRHEDPDRRAAARSRGSSWLRARRIIPTQSAGWLAPIASSTPSIRRPRDCLPCRVGFRPVADRAHSDLLVVRRLVNLRRSRQLPHRCCRSGRWFVPAALSCNASVGSNLPSDDRVEGSDGIVEGGAVADVRPSHPARTTGDLARSGTIGLDNEVDCQAAR